MIIYDRGRHVGIQFFKCNFRSRQAGAEWEGMLRHNNFDSFIYFHNSGLTNFLTFQDYFISFA
jgi:hypothetical protein